MMLMIDGELLDRQDHFYKFLEPLSKELSNLANELETAIFKSPRMMLTHSRLFVESLVKLVIKSEKLQIDPMLNFKDQLDMLSEEGYLTSEVREAFHFVRLLGNKAAHDTRDFRFSEALVTWEKIYVIVKWFVEVYGPVDIAVPDYIDPIPNNEMDYDSSEIGMRLKKLEDLLKKAIQPGVATATQAPSSEVVATALPGFTTIRSISYKGESLDIPYFLRDAFLLPQRFEKSETFLIRLGAVQQARLMSELPNNLEGLHTQIKRYNEKNDETFFNELKVYIEEEKIRRELMLKKPGEIFLFYKDKHVIVTEDLAKISFTETEFTGSPSLLRQLKADQIETVGQLPSELAILAKYDNVGIKTIESLFEQLKAKQMK